MLCLVIFITKKKKKCMPYFMCTGTHKYFNIAPGYICYSPWGLMLIKSLEDKWLTLKEFDK